MKYIYVNNKGGKPLNIGINKAKRVARGADERDQTAVLKTLGAGLPRQHSHHQELILARHRYYHEQHDELLSLLAQRASATPEAAKRPATTAA